LVRTSAVEVVRAGREIPQHASRGEIIVHGLKGRVAFTALRKTQTLEAGKLVLPAADDAYPFPGIPDASLLLTIHAPRR
jgi:quercetin dioxygenase-like cupin family protein